MWQTRVVFNVASPTLTAFAPNPADANGTAVIICVDLYRDWTAAGKPAELHVFAKGGHGFGMRKQNLPTDHWIDRFTDWLDMQGWLRK